MLAVRRVLMALGLLAGSGSAAAQSAPAVPASAPPPACAAAEYRHFDFWLGEWVVYGGPEHNKLIGRSSITSVALGCGIAEHWRSASGMDGRSLNTYEAGTGWTQFWIGGDGVVLRLQGGLRDGAMVMQGTLPGAHGVQLQRITWTPAADGSVSQHWETSDDGGASWATAFLGIYRRTAE